MHSQLKFDPDTHRYTKDGVLVPNVTTILKEIVDYSMVPESILEYASQRGTAAHRATELYDLDDLDDASVTEPIRPYLDAWIRFRNDMGFIVNTVEQRVFHPKHWYAGTLDRTGVFLRSGSPDGKILLDIKTTSRLMPSTGPQLAAYQEAYNYRRKDKIKERWAVLLRKDGSYQLQMYPDKADLQIFRACLQLYNWRLQHGK